MQGLAPRRSGDGWAGAGMEDSISISSPLAASDMSRSLPPPRSGPSPGTPPSPVNAVARADPATPGIAGSRSSGLPRPRAASIVGEGALLLGMAARARPSTAPTVRHADASSVNTPPKHHLCAPRRLVAVTSLPRSAPAPPPPRGGRERGRTHDGVPVAATIPKRPRGGCTPASWVDRRLRGRSHCQGAVFFTRIGSAGPNLLPER